MAITTDLNHADPILRKVAKVRDRVGAPHIIFDDDSYVSDLEDSNGSIIVAAALRLTSIANSEAHVQKVIKTLELETDGDKLAASYLASAKLLLSMVSVTTEAPAPVEETAPTGKTYFPRRIDGYSRC
jgi:hypothetical protein